VHGALLQLAVGLHGVEQDGVALEGRQGKAGGAGGRALSSARGAGRPVCARVPWGRGQAGGRSRGSTARRVAGGGWAALRQALWAGSEPPPAAARQPAGCCHPHTPTPPHPHTPTHPTPDTTPTHPHPTPRTPHTPPTHPQHTHLVGLDGQEALGAVGPVAGAADGGGDLGEHLRARRAGGAVGGRRRRASAQAQRRPCWSARAQARKRASKPGRGAGRGSTVSPPSSHWLRYRRTVA
jgi:hypothetical protein